MKSDKTLGNWAAQTNPLTDSLIQRSPVFYGWIIFVAGTLGIIMTSPGQT
ncbi:hypothetical protein MNBD_CHLOROFLEXI01-1398 [hydrothermal vent metagenome]|uniref:Uncharacterized protein n=1 Tax=hydrothermal vent metagenome TaxID=652676 RepID=A0A3B0WBF9_9ZZZZ